MSKDFNCPIPGVTIRKLTRYSDKRGWLTELFRHDELETEFFPAMTYLSMTDPGAARGPHEHAEQADLFCFLGPSTFRVYLWDNRANSPTYGESFRIELGQDSPASMIVPKGVVHAYKNIGDCEGLVFNAPNRLYAGPGRTEPVDEIRHEDDPDTPYVLD
ncbi:MAG: dTDP-4-dehydrorhamnose 3,5-epimerase family protein [candidate division Zixibacteria bacterium]|nr:dTDP-4-dehydrorhamnose 3,5-epimerase family protein [candidate division Zixibacteria bacterium]